MVHWSQKLINKARLGNNEIEITATIVSTKSGTTRAGRQGETQDDSDPCPKFNTGFTKSTTRDTNKRRYNYQR